MIRSRPATIAALFLFAIFDTAPPIGAADGFGSPEAGRVLFERNWQTAGSHGPLGPVYNERSCVACHDQGGVGGAGPNSKNVDLLTVEVPARFLPRHDAQGKVLQRPEPVVKEIQKFQEKLMQIHVSLAGGSTVLHAYGTDPRYTMFRKQALGLIPMGPRAVPNAAPPSAAERPYATQPIERIRHADMTLLLSGRNSTAMFGAGLIDAIPNNEITLVAEIQAKKHPRMKGRFLGRFGWRGQTADLSRFVAGACGVELGLDVPDATPTTSPVGGTLRLRHQNDKVILFAGEKSSPPKGPELDRQEFSDLVAFVASLPRPERRTPADAADAQTIRHGEAIFESTECAVCHRSSLGGIDGLYSDLLLHDMGSELYDPQPPPSSTWFTPIAYYHTDDIFDFADSRRPYEWRTPPLWGLADSAPYLHDGRAATIEAAVLQHGGQAAGSVEKFRSLSVADRGALLKFLSSLIAPRAEHLKRPLPSAPATARQPAETDPALSKEQIFAERVASSRLELARAARERGDSKTANHWLEAVIYDYPSTKAAAEADALLNPK